MVVGNPTRGSNAVPKGSADKGLAGERPDRGRQQLVEEGGEVAGGVGGGEERHDDDKHGEIVVCVEEGDEEADLLEPGGGSTPAVGSAVAEEGEVSAGQRERRGEEVGWDGGWGLTWVLREMHGESTQEGGRRWLGRGWGGVAGVEDGGVEGGN